jgi:hypothetical protein
MHFSLSRGAGARHFSQRHYARRPRKREVERTGIEPVTSGLQSRRSPS